MKKILFLHGLESTPGGSKPVFLKSLGFDVIEPDLRNLSFENAVELCQSIFDENDPSIVVGSSRGGAIAMALELRSNMNLILFAPAWKKYGVNFRKMCPTFILHSKNDDLIDFNDSQLLKNCTLIECGENHRMNDEDAFENLRYVINNIS
jgi:hypothetical protein